MFDLFGFSPKDYGDEELTKRIADLAKRIIWAHRMGQNAAAGQLQAQQMQCQQELRMRQAQPGFQRLLASEPVCVETDPDLAQEGRQERDARVEAATPKAGPRQKPLPITRDRVRTTLRPTKDI